MPVPANWTRRTNGVSCLALAVILSTAVLSSSGRSNEPIRFGTKAHYSRFTSDSDQSDKAPPAEPYRDRRRLPVPSPTDTDGLHEQTPRTVKNAYSDMQEGVSEFPRLRRNRLSVAPSPPLAVASPIRSASTRDAQPDHHESSGVWWNQPIHATVLEGRQPVRVSLESLITSALIHSAQVQVYKDLPLIRETAIMEADATFDWASFVESRWNDINEPVGNLLTTNQRRFSDHNLNTSFGIRRRNTLGGDFEIAQRFGQQNTNSQFFIPHNQATTRLTLSYTQPLLRGAGRVYNTSLTVLAGFERNIANEELSKQLQSHLLDVAKAYWGLYLERGNLLQRRRLLDRAITIHDALIQRSEIDSLRSQIVRARSAVESRRADIVRAEMAIKNSESRIRALVNDPSLGSYDTVELVPQDEPFDDYYEIDIPYSVEQAIQNRPEINQAMEQIKAAGVRCNMSKNELLPTLNLVLETYASGLRGNSNAFNSYVDQFTEGSPSYSVGLQYEMPIWNRAAQARHQRRRLELRQLESQFRTTLETLKLEVEVAVREVITTYREVEAKFRAMDAAQAEVNYLQDRWELLPGDDRSASLLLEDLLDAQERLAAAEYEYLNAQLSYSLAQMSYKKATGILLIAENISADRFCECDLPRIDLNRANSELQRMPVDSRDVEPIGPAASPPHP